MREKAPSMVCRQFILVMTLGLVLSTIVSCKGGGGNNANSSAPNIAVTGRQLAFGGVVIANFADKSLSLQNVGGSELLIGAILQFDPTLSPFSIVTDDCSGVTLARLATCSLKIRFTPPRQDTFSATLNIPSNDTDENPLVIDVNGRGRAYNVSINQVSTDACPGRIKLLISVTDQDRVPVAGLVGKVVVLENGLPAQDVIISEDTTVLPVSVGLVLDYSASTTPFKNEIESASIFFIGLLKPNDEAEIIKFATNIETAIGFTSIQDDLKDAIEAAFPPGGQRTSLYDAAHRAISDTASRSNEKRAVILLADGEDNTSVRTLSDVINLANENSIPIFTIGIGNANVETMQTLANETGGQYFLSPTTAELQDIYLEVSQVLTNQYLIEYKTSSTGGSLISVNVEVDDGGLQGEGAKNAKGC